MTDLVDFHLRVTGAIEREAQPTRARLMEALRDTLPWTYEDPSRAYDLFMRVADADTLQERERAASEIKRLAPRGFAMSEAPTPTPTATAQEGKMKTGEMFPSKYLKADDLPNGYRANLLITKFRLEEIESDGKTKDAPVVYFRGAEKGLVLNRTNADSLTDITGSDDSDDWIGKVVCVFKTKVRFGDKRVNAVRIDPASDDDGRAPAEAEPESETEEETPKTREAGWKPTDDDVPF